MPNQTGLDQSASDFDELLPLANRETKLAKSVANEQAVFRLNSLGIATNRDEWAYDFDADKLSDKIYFFCRVYRDEMQRFALEKPEPRTVSDWVNRSIKWTSELESHVVKGDGLAFNGNNVIPAMYRPFVTKHCYYAPLITHRRYQQPQIFPHDVVAENTVIAFCAKGMYFYVLASDRLPDLHFTGDSQCLPLYRYTADGDRVSNITEWGLRQFREHYSDEGISAEDIFAYTYAVLHDPVYRHDYRLDLLRDFPRLPFYHEFNIWKQMGQELLDLHIGFEQAEPYPLERVDLEGEPKRVILRADKAAGAILLDDKTTLRGIPPEAWEYQLGSRSALEWVLDQYKERKPRDPTIREKFNTYRFSDHKEGVIDLLQRVCTVSVATMEIVDSMAQHENVSQSTGDPWPLTRTSSP